MLKKLKVKKYDFDANKYIVVLNELDALDLGVHPLDRVMVYSLKDEYLFTAVVDIAKKSLNKGEIGIFSDIYENYDVDDFVYVKLSPQPKSVDYIKRKMDNEKLQYNEIETIVNDIKNNNLSDIELTAFVSSIYINGLSLDETYALAKSIGDSGDKITFDSNFTVVDKHSIGGINGRATMLLVPIVANTDLYIPKTSSRAITSACGTADAMEVLADVSLDPTMFKNIVLKEHGAIVWGGGFKLAPVDDKIIKIEHALSLDPQEQVIASVLAKKYAVGSKYVVIDIPLGKDMKVKTLKEANDFAHKIIYVGSKLGMKLNTIITNATEPSGPAFGPALEAKHVMEILEGKATSNLKDKALDLAASIFELSNYVSEGEGLKLAKKILNSGKALIKMRKIISEQGKKVDKSKDIELGEYTYDILTESDFKVKNFDLKKLTEIARLSGAPLDKGAGLLLKIKKDDFVYKDSILFTIYAENKDKLDQAVKYAKRNLNSIIY